MHIRFVPLVAVAIGSLAAMVLLPVGRRLLSPRGVAQAEERGSPVAKLSLFGLFFVFGLSVFPLLLHMFVVSQMRIGQADVGLGRLLRENEFGVTLGVWGLMGLGLLIALPILWTDFFGFTTYVGPNQGALVADLGMTLSEVGAHSSLRLARPTREAMTGSTCSTGEAVFDFAVVETALRFEGCRYYWLETGGQDDPKIVRINIGISTRKLPRVALGRERERVIRGLREAGWSEAHFEAPEPAFDPHASGICEGDEVYWTLRETVLVLRENRVDEPKRGEDALYSGEFILSIELVPRANFNEGKRGFEAPGLGAQRQQNRETA